MPLLVIATVVVLTGGFRLTVAMRPRTACEVLVGTIAMSAALLILDSLLMGSLLRTYRPGALAGGAAVLTAVSWAGSKLLAPRAQGSHSWRMLDIGARYTLTRARAHPLVLALAVLVTVEAVIRYTLAYLLPNIDWDGSYYHLLPPDAWTQAGRIVHTPMTMWANAYPLDVETIMGWPAVFLHSEDYAAFAQMPFYLLAALSTAGLARRLRVRRSYAVLAGLLFLATPAVFVQMSSSYIDVTSAAFALATVYLTTGLPSAVRLAPEPSRAWVGRLLAVGLTCGLACGSKSTGLVLVPIVLGYVVWHRSLSSVRRAAITGPVLVATAGLSTGGFWYFRAWATYGDPFYPVSMLGFKGLGSMNDVLELTEVPPQWRTLSVPARLVASWLSDLHPQPVVYDQRVGGLGALWILAVVPAAFAAVVLWWRAGRKGVVVALYSVSIAVIIVVSPDSWWARYILTGVGLALTLAVRSFEDLSRALARRADPAAFPSAGFVRSLAALLVMFSMAAATIRIPIFSTSVTSDSLSQVVRLAASPDRMDVVWPWNEYTGLDLVPDGSRVGVLPGSTFFPHELYGNEIQRVPVVLPPMTTAGQLAAVLSQQAIAYVFISPSTQGPMLAALQNAPQLFIQLNSTPDDPRRNADPGRGVLFRLVV